MPVSIARLRELIDLAASEGVGGIDLAEGGTHIRITRGAAPLVRSATSTAASQEQGDDRPNAGSDIFSAPMFGVLHLTPAPGAAAYVAPGDRVVKGQQLCLIEAMKMFHAVHCDRDGRITAILAEPGLDVARGQPLFRISEA